MLKFVLRITILIFLGCLGEGTEVTAFNCIIQLLLLGHIFKDVIEEAWEEQFNKEG